NLAVVVVVCKAGAARYCAYAQHTAGLLRNVFKLATAKTAEERVLLRNEMNQSAVEDQNVRLTIIVEIVDARSPTNVLSVRLRNAVRSADVFETLLADIPQK